MTTPQNRIPQHVQTLASPPGRHPGAAAGTGERERAGVLSLTVLTDAEYPLSAVARGLDEYYTGSRESPGVWTGTGATRQGLVGGVEPDHLRAMVRAHDPETGTDWLAGRRARKNNCFDATLSAP